MCTPESANLWRLPGRLSKSYAEQACSRASRIVAKGFTRKGPLRYRKDRENSWRTATGVPLRPSVHDELCEYCQRRPIKLTHARQ